MSGAPVETPEAALRKALEQIRECMGGDNPAEGWAQPETVWEIATAALAAPSVAPTQPGKLFWPTDPAHPCPTCGASVLTQEPAAPSPERALLKEVGHRFLRGDKAEEVLAYCDNEFQRILKAAPPAQSTEPCPCGDGPGHGAEWCEDYTEKARIDAAVAAERERCAGILHRAMTMRQVVDENISNALDAIRAAAPSQGQAAEEA